MLRTTFLLFLFLVMTLAGCSVNPRSYDSSHSEAYNLARAGGLAIDIKDTKVPANEIGSITESMLDAGWVGAGYLKPQLGLSNWGTAGFNLVGNLLEPETHGERNSLFAWMPLSKANSEEEAIPAILSHVKDSVSAALNEMEAENTIFYENDGVFFSKFAKDEWNCPTSGSLDDLCYVKVYIFEPYKFGTPDYISGAKDRKEGEGFEQRYVFTSNHKNKFHRLEVVTTEKHTVPEDRIYRAISKNLPEWVYLYLAPGKVKNKSGELINYPYILTQGKTEFFVIPKN